MQRRCCYSFSTLLNPDHSTTLLQRLDETVNQWIAGKGELDDSGTVLYLPPQNAAGHLVTPSEDDNDSEDDSDGEAAAEDESARREATVQSHQWDASDEELDRLRNDATAAKPPAWVADLGPTDLRYLIDHLQQPVRLRRLTLTEPIANGSFRTILEWGGLGGEVMVWAALEAASDIIGHHAVDVFCPRVVRQFLEAHDGWQTGDVAHNGWGLPSPKPRVVEGGSGFYEHLFSADRLLPTIAVSRSDGFLIDPNLPEKLARDLAGLAEVLIFEDSAAWEITQNAGKEWSCYSGAIRLYWPGLDAGGNPYAHPLWTSWKLLYGGRSPSEAARRIARELRRRIMTQAASGLRMPPRLARLRRLDESARRARRADKHSNAEWTALLEEDNSAKDARIADLEQQIEGLKDKVTSLQKQLNNQTKGKTEAEDAEIAPETEETDEQFETVRDALNAARVQFREQLAFSPECDRCDTLAPDAGPPSTIYRHLEVLAEASAAGRVEQNGGWSTKSLGSSLIDFVKSRGANASTESETKLGRCKKPKNPEARHRTFKLPSGGEELMVFHTKPSDSTSPDYCPRIYFKRVSGEKEKIVVGYVGRHFDD